MGLKLSKSTAEEDRSTHPLHFVSRFHGDYEFSETFVELFRSSCWGVVVGDYDLKSMLHSIFHRMNRLGEENIVTDSLYACDIFQTPTAGVYDLIKLVTFVILIADTSWNKRLFLLFELYKNRDKDTVMHEDLQLIAYTCLSCLRLYWPKEEADGTEANQEEDDNKLRQISEAFADECYLKNEKDLADNFDRDTFVKYMIHRFPAHVFLHSRLELFDQFQSVTIAGDDEEYAEDNLEGHNNADNEEVAADLEES